MNKTEVLVSHNRITTLTLKGVNGLNILSYDTIKQIAKSLDIIEKDNSIEVIIITGSGNKAFCSGADINELATMQDDLIDEYVSFATDTYQRIENLHCPVIGAINGYAFGAAFELLLTCDLRIMSNSAKIGQPAIRHGLIPPFGGLHRLPEIVGMGLAKQIIFTTEEMSAEECYRIGLVNKICDFEQLEEETLKLAERIILGKKYSLSTVKNILNNYKSLDSIKLQEKALSDCLRNKETQNQLLSFFERNRLKDKKNI
ncbi:MAG: enoyl-CoA hydratase/isomerase family protein [Candidatus Sericytochromatia bacterium]